MPICLTKCLELALNQGEDMLTGKQLGCCTPEPETFTSIEDVMEAYLKQLNFGVDKMVKIHNIAYPIFPRLFPMPFTSALLEGCIKEATDAHLMPFHTFPDMLL